MALAGLGAVDLMRPGVNRPGERRYDFYGSTRGSFDPKINRHTGRPHEHKREIARRLRQEARKAERIGL